MAHQRRPRRHLPQQARRIYAEQLVKGMPAVVQAVAETARTLLDKPSEHARLHARAASWCTSCRRAPPVWHKGMVDGLRDALLERRVGASRPATCRRPGAAARPLSLVDDDTIEREILSSRLALAMMDRASWEFTDLRSRMTSLERREELDANDMLRAARAGAHRRSTPGARAGCSLDGWRELQPVLHEEFVALVEEAYHETNRWLVEQRRAARRRPAAVHPRARTHRRSAAGGIVGCGRRLRRADRHGASAAVGPAGSATAAACERRVTARQRRRRDAHDDARRARWRAAASMPRRCSAG